MQTHQEGDELDQQIEDLFIDQLRKLSSETRTQYVQEEERTNWVNTLAVNTLFHYAILTLFYSTFWLLVVAAGLDLSILLWNIVSFVLTSLIMRILIGVINDRSQFAKMILIIGQCLALLAGFLFMLAGKGYFAEQRKHIGLHEI